MGQINSVNVEISVVLGRSVLPMQQLLRMGRGAVIALDALTWAALGGRTMRTSQTSQPVLAPPRAGGMKWLVTNQATASLHCPSLFAT